jgi:hypothetical protein
MGPLVAAAPAASAAAPYVVAGISALSGAAGAASTGAQNRKSRAFSREMYQQQKMDNIAFWDMQNEYNSPQKQMERLRNAGLNPNMLYDKTGAVIPAQNINTPDVQGGQFRTPDFGSVGTGLVQGYFDTKIKQAQYDNMKATNTNILQDTLLKMSQAQFAGASAEEKARYNYVLGQTQEALVENTFTDLQKKKADLAYTLDENARKAAMAAPTLQKAVIDAARADAGLNLDKEQLRLLQQNVYNAEQEGIFKKVQATFAQNGVNFNDPVIMRWIGDYIGGFLEGDTGSFKTEGYKFGKGYKNFRELFK